MSAPDQIDALRDVIREQSAEIERLKADREQASWIITAICLAQPTRMVFVPSEVLGRALADAGSRYELQRISDYTGVKFRVVDNENQRPPEVRSSGLRCSHGICLFLQPVQA